VEACDGDVTQVHAGAQRVVARGGANSPQDL